MFFFKRSLLRSVDNENICVVDKKITDINDNYTKKHPWGRTQNLKLNNAFEKNVFSVIFLDLYTVKIRQCNLHFAGLSLVLKFLSCFDGILFLRGIDS